MPFPDPRLCQIIDDMNSQARLHDSDLEQYFASIDLVAGPLLAAFVPVVAPTAAKLNAMETVPLNELLGVLLAAALKGFAAGLEYGKPAPDPRAEEQA